MKRANTQQTSRGKFIHVPKKMISNVLSIENVVLFDVLAGAIEGEVLEISLTADSVVTVTADTQFENACTAKRIFVDYPKLAKSVQVG